MVNGSRSDNVFRCVQKNSTRLILEDNLLVNNVPLNTGILELILTSADLKNNTWSDTCHPYCISMTDTNIYIEYDEEIQNIANFSYVDHQTSKNSICINNSVSDGNPSYFTFAESATNNNTQIIFPECYGTDLFELSSPNVSLPIISTHEQKLYYTTPGASVDKSIICYDNTTSCAIICNESVSCFLSDFFIETSITTILCSSIYSCGSIKGFALGGFNNTYESIDILCNADSSCIAGSFTIDHVDYVQIHCVESLSCSQMSINITNSIDASIACYELSSNANNKFFAESWQLKLLILNSENVFSVSSLYIVMDRVTRSKSGPTMTIPPYCYMNIVRMYYLTLPLDIMNTILFAIQRMHISFPILICL